MDFAFLLDVHETCATKAGLLLVLSQQHWLEVLCDPVRRTLWLVLPAIADLVLVYCLEELWHSRTVPVSAVKYCTIACKLGVSFDSLSWTYTSDFIVMKIDVNG